MLTVERLVEKVESVRREGVSTDNETRLRRVLMRLSNQRPVTESGVKAALALALWTQTQLPTINQCPRRPKWRMNICPAMK